jgi:hypothetical protein
MSAASRRKGLTGEREVAVMFEMAGREIRNLEATGDIFVCADNGWPLARPAMHVEVKRQERTKLPEWLRQAKAEAPQGTIPVVCFRQNRGEWYAALPLSALVELAS